MSTRQGLRRFFPYYGGKWRIAPNYPKPRYPLIVEPFAGSAGYSLRYFKHMVLLCDVDSTIVGLWEYLTKVSSEEIRSLPLLGPGQCVEDLNVVQEVKWLIGFWINQGSSVPRNVPSTWMKKRRKLHIRLGRNTQLVRGATTSFWEPRTIHRIANQVEHIRHWKVVQGSYADLENEEATWFVDPPYKKSGKHYKHCNIGYPSLGAWCLSRSGQLIVCEEKGANWLPFEPLTAHRGAANTRVQEVVYLR